MSHSENHPRLQSIHQVLARPPQGNASTPIPFALAGHLGYPQAEQSSHVPFQDPVLSETLIHSAAIILHHCLDFHRVVQFIFIDREFPLHLLTNVLFNPFPLAEEELLRLVLGVLVAHCHRAVWKPLHEYGRVLLLDQYGRRRNDSSDGLHLRQRHERKCTAGEPKHFTLPCREHAVVLQGEEDLLRNFQRVAGGLQILQLAHGEAQLLAGVDLTQAHLLAQQLVEFGANGVPSIGQLNGLCINDLADDQDHRLRTVLFEHENFVQAGPPLSNELLHIPCAQHGVNGLRT
mmetsp:Transcript_14521/g.36644  ORF Transcript_14521/g.36644 Transcript_14521/m.36644 type:complete len:290 (+) Transcript_14521:2639-3508(+)